jgi:hypothetical protein
MMSSIIKCLSDCELGRRRPGVDKERAELTENRLRPRYIRGVQWTEGNSPFYTGPAILPEMAPSVSNSVLLVAGDAED